MHRQHSPCRFSSSEIKNKQKMRVKIITIPHRLCGCRMCNVQLCMDGGSSTNARTFYNILKRQSSQREHIFRWFQAGISHPVMNMLPFTYTMANVLKHSYADTKYYIGDFSFEECNEFLQNRWNSSHFVTKLQIRISKYKQNRLNWCTFMHYNDHILFTIEFKRMRQSNKSFSINEKWAEKICHMQTIWLCEFVWSH